MEIMNVFALMLEDIVVVVARLVAAMFLMMLLNIYAQMQGMK